MLPWYNRIPVLFLMTNTVKPGGGAILVMLNSAQIPSENCQLVPDVLLCFLPLKDKDMFQIWNIYRNYIDTIEPPNNTDYCNRYYIWY